MQSLEASHRSSPLSNMCLLQTAGAQNRSAGLQEEHAHHPGARAATYVGRDPIPCAANAQL